VTAAQSTPSDPSALESLRRDVDRLQRVLTPGGQDKARIERDAEALAARQAEARSQIAAISADRVAGAKAWLTQIGKARAALEKLTAANAELVEITNADSAAFEEQDRLKLGTGLREDVIPARLLANLDLSYLTGAVRELEQQGRAAINSWEKS
jgi:hypothetical protein